MSSIRPILFTIALLFAMAMPVGGQPRPAADAPPSTPLDADLLAAVGRLDLAREHYTKRRLADAEREVSDAIDLVRKARERANADPAAGIGRPLPRAGTDVPMPALVKRVSPAYPPEAAKDGVTGQVVVDAVIDKSGRIRDARAARSVPSLDGAAIAAVRRWRFAPPTVNGAPAEVAVTLVLAFTFRRDTLPTDDLDLARFYAERRDDAEAERALARALDAIRRESACFSGARRIGPGGVIRPPAKIKDVRPVYPPLAQSARVSGMVVMEAAIDADGRVRCARVIRSVPMLDQAALDAVAQWEFAPALLDGVPAPVIMVVTVNFTLR